MTSTQPLIAGIAEAMKHLSQRQRVIAENIANGETPRYKAREVEKPDFSALLESQGVHRGIPNIARPRIGLTTGMMAMGARPPRGADGIILDADTSETKPDGNNVTLEDQLLKMGAVQADFAAMTNLYRKQMGLIRSALGRN